MHPPQKQQISSSLTTCLQLGHRSVFGSVARRLTFKHVADSWPFRFIGTHKETAVIYAAEKLCLLARGFKQGSQTHLKVERLRTVLAR